MIAISECYRGCVGRLSRAELQLRNRAAVLAAARAEFAEHGYRDATIDRIAARADLTRGAVYSNFPSKRALFFSTLIPQPDTSTPARELAVSTPVTQRGLSAVGLSGADFDSAGSVLGPESGRGVGPRPVSVAAGLAGFAAAWLEHEHPGPDLLPELADVGTPYAGLLGLNAVLLGLSLDRLEPGHLGRMIGISRLALTMLTGATQLTSAPGFVQPLAIARACAHLADLDPPDPWVPPPTTPPVRPADEPADFDGIVAVLGLGRLSAAEDVVRTTTAPTTIALVSSAPDELGPLARYTTGTLLDCLQQSLPRVRIVHDEAGVLASTIGCDMIGDSLEYAVSVANGRIVGRAEGFGAAQAIARRSI